MRCQIEIYQFQNFAFQTLRKNFVITMWFRHKITQFLWTCFGRPKTNTIKKVGSLQQALLLPVVMWHHRYAGLFIVPIMKIFGKIIRFWEILRKIVENFFSKIYKNSLKYCEVRKNFEKFWRNEEKILVTFKKNFCKLQK